MKKLITIFLLTTLALQSPAQWTNVGLAFTGTVRGIYFQDETTGYAVGGDGVTFAYASKTSDGGVTWSSATISGSNLLRSVQFLDANTGYACGQGGVVVKTTDGGNTWSNIYTDATQYFRAIDFVSSTTGYMAGAVGTIWKTTNGGTSWSSYSTGISSDFIQLHMVDANTGYACASFSTSPFSAGYIFKTIDGGTTWSQVYNDPATGLLGLAVYDANTLYVGGTNQIILKSTDGGSTWSSSFVGLVGPAIRTGVVVTSDRIFMADDGGYVQATADAGGNWANVFYASGGIYAMHFPSKSIGYAGDLSGNIWKYDANAVCTVDVPTGLGYATLDTKAQLFWNPSPGAVKYTLRYQSSGGTWTVNNNQNVRIIKNLTPNTKYVWSVKAYCGLPVSGSSEWSDKSSFITLPPQKIGDGGKGSSLEVFPNPLSSLAKVNFTLDHDSKVTASLFTVDGKKVMTIADAQFSFGLNQITLDRGSLASGIYILHIKTDENLMVRKIEIE